jgi:hypothetical protein
MECLGVDVRGTYRLQLGIWPGKQRTNVKNIVHCKMVKRDKDGNRVEVLQAFEIVNGQRRPISSPTKTNSTSLVEKWKTK